MFSIVKLLYLIYNEYGDIMITIKNNVINEIVINKSRFICLLYKINNIDEINNILDNIKKEYKDATHCCYGYIINNNIKCSDDGEPNSTAGKPILNVLLKNKLDNILCIVVRYFGGIKLGVGGLTRAYTSSITEALSKCEIVALNKAYRIAINFNYDKNKVIDNCLKNILIIKKDFNDTITYEIIIDTIKYENILNVLNDECNNINILGNEYI